MRSAPAILIVLALLLLYGTAAAAFRQVFGVKEVAFNLVLPLILIISAVKIWRIQHSGGVD